MSLVAPSRPRLSARPGVARGQPSERVASPAHAGPQTHLVRGRTDATWRQEANGRQVHGRQGFFSDVALEVVVDTRGKLLAGPHARPLSADGALMPLRRSGGARRRALGSRGARRKQRAS